MALAGQLDQPRQEALREPVEDDNERSAREHRLERRPGSRTAQQRHGGDQRAEVEQQPAGVVDDVLRQRTPFERQRGQPAEQG